MTCELCTKGYTSRPTRRGDHIHTVDGENTIRPGRGKTSARTILKSRRPRPQRHERRRPQARAQVPKPRARHDHDRARLRGQQYFFTLREVLKHVDQMLETKRIVGDEQEAVLVIGKWLSTPVGKAALNAKFQAAMGVFKIAVDVDTDEELTEQTKRLAVLPESELLEELHKLEGAVAMKRFPPVTSRGPAPKIGPHGEEVGREPTPQTRTGDTVQLPVESHEKTHYGRTR